MASLKAIPIKNPSNLKIKTKTIIPIAKFMATSFKLIYSIKHSILLIIIPYKININQKKIININYMV